MNGDSGLKIRFSNSRPLRGSIGCNGSLWQTVSLPGVGNDPSWRMTNGESLWIEGFSLNAGSGNTSKLEASDWAIAIVELLIVTHNRLSQA